MLRHAYKICLVIHAWIFYTLPTFQSLKHMYGTIMLSAWLMFGLAEWIQSCPELKVLKNKLSVCSVATSCAWEFHMDNIIGKHELGGCNVTFRSFMVLNILERNKTLPVSFRCLGNSFLQRSIEILKHLLDCFLCTIVNTVQLRSKVTFARVLNAY